jgi:hypothetical protein
MGTVLKYCSLELVGDPQEEHFYKLVGGTNLQEPNSLGVPVPANSTYELRVSHQNVPLEYQTSRPEFPNLVVVYPHDNTSSDLIIAAISTYPYAGPLPAITTPHPSPPIQAVAQIRLENPTNEELTAFFEFSLHFGVMIRP